MWNLNGIIITKNEDGYHWKQSLTDELVMTGKCTVNGRVLILHSYESVEPEKLPEVQDNWDITEFYMTVSETGVTEIFNSSGGDPVSGEIKKEIGTQVGCTMRYRQG